MMENELAADIDGLIAEIAAQTNVDTATARRALGTIASFISSEAPAGSVQALFGKLPGADALAAEYRGAAGGGLFGVFNALMAIGISIADMPKVTASFLDFAKTHGAERELKDVVNAIPGLAQFV